MEVEVRVQGVGIDPTIMMLAVILSDDEGQRSLRIFIVHAEAMAIELAFRGVETPRPMTHDLLKNTIEKLQAKTVKVVINDLVNNTFLATIWLERDGQPVEIDSRASDAIALAQREKCPILVNEVVFEKFEKEQAGHMMGRQEAQEMTEEKIKNMFDGMDPDKMGHA